MNWLDLTLPTPAENLACDEALLDASEAGRAGNVLRFWEPTQYFVVVGYANAVNSEVNRPACDALGIPVLRRCSGGGTVLQGPGCLNYSLVLDVNGHNQLGNITSANRFIMDRNRAALESILHRPVAVRGHTDLVVDGRKVSGNAQRRHRRFLLFHGTFLLGFDLSLVERLLPMPSRQPDYRSNRPHGDFLSNLGVTAGTVKAALRDAWDAGQPLEAVPHDAIATLARGKYATPAWNLKF